MTRFAAFLRGVNLGKRKVLSADLVRCFNEMGFADAKPLLASGNVLFEAEDDPSLAGRIEAGLHKHFGFPVGTVLRTGDELAAMVAREPFGEVQEDENTKLYVVLMREVLPAGLDLPSVAGDYTIIRVDPREVYILAHRLPNGRYGEGMDKLGKVLDKAGLATTRNWNTIVKAAR